MRTGRNSCAWALFAIIAAVALRAQPGLAAASESANLLQRATKLPLKADVHLTAGTRPEYFTDPGRYSNAELYLNLSPHKKLRYQIYQTVRFPEKLISPQEAAADIGDTKFRVSWAGLLSNNPLGLSINARSDLTLLPNSVASKRSTLQSAFAQRLYVSKKWGAATFYVIPEYKANFHKERLNQDGVANASQQWMLISSASYDYRKISAAFTYAPIQQIRYGRTAPLDLYYFNPEISYRWDNNFALAIGLETTDSQLKSGQRAPVYVYKEDLTEVYARLETTL